MLPPSIQTQAVGQLTYLKPYVTDFSPEWLAGSTLALVAGAMSLVYIADTISELKLGNGTSVLIFAGIASSLPASVGALLAANASDDPGNVVIYAVAFFLTTLGIIYVQVGACCCTCGDLTEAVSPLIAGKQDCWAIKRVDCTDPPCRC